MKGFILGYKNQVGQIFTDKGDRIPVTSVIAGSCYLVDILTMEKHGYNGALLGFGQIKKNIKTRAGILKKAGIKTPLRFLREIRLDSADNIEEGTGKKSMKIGENTFAIGELLTPEKMFTLGENLTITGKSKGKGFAGVVKRHGFAGGPATHGQSDRHRAPGSIGASTTPGRVMMGKRMAGRMGGEMITRKGLTVVNLSESEIVVKGLIPGSRGGLLIIKA